MVMPFHSKSHYAQPFIADACIIVTQEKVSGNRNEISDPAIIDSDSIGAAARGARYGGKAACHSAHQRDSRWPMEKNRD
uniref:Uncharacterized protein n=1 Tax=Sphaerodactylus townsendi TaxID=933632 RepID=A0ACB8E9J6_9SAUR